MTRASDNSYPSILITEGTEPSAPAAGKQRVYIDSTSHRLSRTDSAGAEVDLEAGKTSPGYEFDYVEFTSNVTPTATTEATANTIVTGSSVAYDGSTIVEIKFFAIGAIPDTGAAARGLFFVLYDGSSSIGRWGVRYTPAASTDSAPVALSRRLTPSNASHTYSVRAWVNAGTGTVIAGAGGNGNDMPGYIRITRV